MSRPILRVGIGLATVALATAAGLPSGAQTPAAEARPPCIRALVALDDTLDSAKAKSGDVFQFQLVDAATAPDGTALPSGTYGYGIVANASHADRGGRGGYLALETRFFVLEDGRRISAIIDRNNEQGSTALGSTANAPGVLGLIPIVGYAVGGYDAMHHGKDATIPRGTRVGVYIGDDAALGTCRAPRPGESPAPVPPPPSAAPVTVTPSVSPTV